MLWRLLDPLLLKIRSRFDHLDAHSPSDYEERFLRTLGTIDPRAIVMPTARVQTLAPRENLRVGAYTQLEGEILLLTPQSRCTIGHHSFLGRGTRLWVQGTMSVGDFVMIAPGVDVFDNDSHPLDAAMRREDALDIFERKRPMNYGNVLSAEVVIEDDVWIGAKSTITKGVRIGRGAVVAAGSVVTRNVEPFTLVAGNPARVIRALDDRKP
jgi:acetyltransferase-like isoleucine patch superfamily enzyme